MGRRMCSLRRMALTSFLFPPTRSAINKTELHRRTSCAVPESCFLITGSQRIFSLRFISTTASSERMAVALGESIVPFSVPRPSMSPAPTAQRIGLTA